MFGFLHTNAQEVNDTLFESRNSAADNLEIFKGAFIDSTLANLKELVFKQQKLIDVDNVIIDQYLPAIKDSAIATAKKLSVLTAEKDASEKGLNEKNDWIFYGIIGGGILFLLFLLFAILYFITCAKKNKLKRQVAGIEKMRGDNLQEIELARKELEKQKETARKEIEAGKESIAKEIYELNNKIDTLSVEKTNLEKKFNDKHTECNQLEKEVAAAYKGIDEYKELYEKQSNDRKQLEERISEVEKATIAASEFAQEHSYLKEEKEKLQEEIKRLADRLEKETKTKNLIEDELRHFLDELRGSRS